MTQTVTKANTIMQTRIDDARNELQRRIQQMLSSGEHDAGAIKQALIDILEKWI